MSEEHFTTTEISLGSGTGQLISNNTILHEWLNRYQDKTLTQARIAINSFNSFIKTQNFSEIDFINKCLNGSPNDKYILLDQYVQHLKQTGRQASTIRNYFTFVRSYLSRHGISTDSQQLKYYVKFPKSIKEQRSPFEKQTIRKILDASDSKYKPFWLCLASSGMRVNELLELRLKWIDLSLFLTYSLPIIKIPAITTKGKSERFTFITSQAYHALKPFIEGKALNDLIFNFSYNSVEQYISWLRKKLEFNERYVSGTHKITIHSFRSFTRTVLSDKVGIEFAYFLLGQSAYLPTYYRQSYDSAAKLYKIAENDLTIN